MAKNEKRPLRFTPEQLEMLTTHEVADLLGNLVLLLRRLPDIPMVDLQSEDRSGVWARHSRSRTEKGKRHDDQEDEQKDLPDWMKNENSGENSGRKE